MCIRDRIAGVGLNLGIDFTGGSLLNYSVGEDFSTDDVETILAGAGYAGSQVTKAAPSDASRALQAELAQNAAETEAEAAETEAPEAEAYAAEASEVEAGVTAAPVLDLDKSGIQADGLTDLQIRLNLVDGAEGLEAAIAAAVQGVLPEAQQASYGALTNAEITDKDLDVAFMGGYMAEFSVCLLYTSRGV